MKKLSLLMASITLSSIMNAQAACPEVGTIDAVKKILTDNGTTVGDVNWALEIAKGKYSFNARDLNEENLKVNTHQGECVYDIVHETLERMSTIGRFTLVETKTPVEPPACPAVQSYKMVEDIVSSKGLTEKGHKWTLKNLTPAELPARVKVQNVLIEMKTNPCSYTINEYKNGLGEKPAVLGTFELERVK